MFIFSGPRAELAKALDYVETYKNGLTAGHGADYESECAVALLRIALAATTALNEHVLDEARGSPDTREFIKGIAEQLPEWPITFNEVADLKRFKTLRIGYCDVPPKNPKARAGRTVFSDFAGQIVSRLDFLRWREAANKAGPEWKHYRKWLKRASDQENRFGGTAEMLGDVRLQNPIVAIHVSEPPPGMKFEPLGEFRKANAVKWRRCGEVFFKHVFPDSHLLPALKKSIRDGDVVYDSQRRARIASRIGKAIAGLAQ